MLTDSKTLKEQFSATRKHSEMLCRPLAIEDFVVQPVDFVSPPKWHLAHTTWYFEQFILKENKKDYTLFDPEFLYLFNSYYESVGEHWVRTKRGNLSRPTVQRINDYREHVTEAMLSFFEEGIPAELLLIVEIGINHEQQHQELLLMDIKFIFGNNPLFPVYDENFKENPIQDGNPEWISIEEGLYEIGFDPKSEGFRYDNEMGRHKVYLDDYQISSHLITNGEYLEFIEDEGYRQVLLWHSDGWNWLQNSTTKAPLYWYKKKDQWFQYTLSGLEPLNLEAPLMHISYYEAFAFVQWKGLRLPTEAEWEIGQSYFGWGSRWEWTESAYLPYPGYKKPKGAIGEYNGKFMANQKVLRGSCIATPEGHTRSTYRNFFHPPMRWEFSGLRVAR